MSTTAGVALLVNGSATTAQFAWVGGKTTFAVKATFGGGSVALQVLLPDGATWVTPSGGSLTADGIVTIDLPPGQVRALVTTATAVYARIDRVPS